MTYAKLPALAAALMLSVAALGYSSYAQAGNMGGDRPDPATAGQGQSNSVNGQPAGMPIGSGDRITGTSTGPHNNTTPAAMGPHNPSTMMPMGRHHMMRHHRRHHHHRMHHHTMAMGSGTMAGPHGGTAMNTPPPNAHSGQTNSDNSRMTGGNSTGRDDSNRGSAPTGGTNGNTPH